MKGRYTRISMLNSGARRQKEFHTAVSLHSHTHHSKEGLDFVPHYAPRIPVVSFFYKREEDRYFRVNGKTLDFRRGYWTPPVTGKRVLDSETNRIERQLGLQPLVSLTDHDDISTSISLHAHNPSQDIPISMEWTVPNGGGIFHLGVHNIPLESSPHIMKELTLYTAKPRDTRFVEILSWLNTYPEILVVLNHPLSHLNSLGIERLKTLVTRFLDRYGNRIHALEINGYRSWSENRATIYLAEQFALPLVSGGDRHGCAPNAVLNLTNAATFSEFVSEIRTHKVSEVLLMPEYREHLVVRKMESVGDFFRYYPEYPHGQRRWTDRVFFQLEDGMVRPLSYYWHHTVPMWVKSFTWIIRFLGSKYLHQVLHKAVVKKEMRLFS
jgi:hypothetical protein